MDETQIEAGFGSGASLGAPLEVSESLWVVMKFGGTSVSTVENWSVIADLVRNRIADGLTPVIVHSALQGVSNELERVLQVAADGKTSDGLAAIRTQH